MNTELLSCPFCGATTISKSNQTVLVQCTECSVTMFQSLRDPESAIKAWNRRIGHSDTLKRAQQRMNDQMLAWDIKESK